MDALEAAEKRQCKEFTNAINTNDDVPVSAQTVADIAEWQSGSKTFYQFSWTYCADMGFHQMYSDS